MNYIKIIISIVICQMAGILGSIFTAQAIPTWYQEIAKPVFNPPNWIFGPVWITLYLLMGISLYLIWQSKKNKKAITWFAIQLFLNALWTPIFFGLKMPTIAFIEIILLWITIIITIVQAYKINKTAAYLLIPYVLWVSFAAVLNFTIALLN